MQRPLRSRALAVMCDARDWTAKRLAAELGLKDDTIYGYMRGKPEPSREFLERAAAAMGLPPEHVDRTLRYVQATDSAAQPGSAASIDRLAITLAMEWEEIHRTQLTRSQRLARALAEREVARILFPRLRAYPAAERQAIVREGPLYQSWAVSELACHESIEAAADDADEALAWADLAVLIADLAPGDEAFRSRSRGYAGAHRGNALRVKGQSLPAADTEHQRAAVLWEAGAAGDPEKLLDEARVLGMRASLRRDQGLLPEALDLLDRALAADRGELRTHLLINRATVLEKLGNYEEAIATLRQTLPYLDAKRQPRLLWSLRFNVLVNFCFMGDFAGAAREIEEVRDLTERLGYGIGLAKLVWLQGWIDAGLGRPTEAETAFEQVRQEFLARDIPFEAALVSLELAVLFLAQGRTAEVRQLARELAPIFQSQKVSAEVLAALVLFREAVDQETLTLEMAKRFLEDLRRNRGLEETEKEPGRKRQGHHRPGTGGKS